MREIDCLNEVLNPVIPICTSCILLPTINEVNSKVQAMQRFLTPYFMTEKQFCF